MTSEVPIFGGEYKHPSLVTNNQRAVNIYPAEPGPGGRGVRTGLRRMGNTLFLDLGLDPIRGIYGFGDYVYVVCGSSVYRLTVNNVTKTATSEVIGTLLTSSGTVRMSNNPFQIIFMDGTYGYIYNFNFTATVAIFNIGGTAGDTYTLDINGVSIYSAFNVATGLTTSALAMQINTLTASTHVTASAVGDILTLTGDSTITTITVAESGTGFIAGVDGITASPGIFESGSNTFSQFQRITDPAFVGGSHVVYINSYFIYNQTDSSYFRFSAQNEGLIYDGADVASAESKPDRLVGLGQTKGEMWAFGTDTIEVWYDNANPEGSPFSKRLGSDIDIGCKAPYTITGVNNLLMWLDSRGYIVQSENSAFIREQSSGYELRKVSDEAFDAEVAGYFRIDDAIACTYNDRGHIMWEITFPTVKKTKVFDQLTGVFHEKTYLNTFTGEEEHSLTQYCFQFKDLLIGGGIRDGKLYLMTHDAFDDNGVPISCLWTTQFFQKDKKEIGVDYLELKLNTGLAPITGAGSDAAIMMRYSNDGGYTWSSELWRDIGAIGEYGKRIIWNRLGSAHEWLLEFKVTAPLDFSVVDASADLDVEED